jgi:DUF1680 family protein
LIASLGQYVYSTAHDEVAVHLYIEGNARISIGGVRVSVQQKTQYPWDGAIEIRVEPEQPLEFALRLRIPGWRRSARLQINGAELDVSTLMDRGYVHVRRRWQKADAVKLDLSMPVERIYAHPEVAADIGRVALKRGPIVYCLEGADNDAPVRRIALPRSNLVETRFERNLLGGVGVLTAQALAARSSKDGALYSTDPPDMRPTTLQAIPYSFWSNRDSEEMSVWIREI